MLERHVFLLVISFIFGGCTSIQLEGIHGESCQVAAVTPTEANDPVTLGLLGQLHVDDFKIFTTADVTQKPRTYLLSTPIDSSAVFKGINQAKSPSISLFHQAKSATDLIPWIDEYRDAQYLSPSATTEANRAREQIAHMWESVPGESSNFRVGRTQPNKSTTFGRFTPNDSDFASNVERTLVLGGYDALTLASFGRLVEILRSYKPEDKELLFQQAQEFNTARFLSTYFRAYFRGGQFIQLSLDTDDLTKEISDDIRRTLESDIQLNEAQKQRITTAIRNYINKTCREPKGAEKDMCLLSRPLGEDSFVTRSGLSVQFGGISIGIGEGGKLSPAVTHPQSTEYGPQLVRVATEAIFDSHGLIVPASANSSACKAKLYSGKNCLSGDASKAAAKGSDLEKIRKLDMYADQAEATITAATSKIIRGWSVVAINNEAVAKSIETLAGVSGRKIVEKGLWSRYRSNDPCASGAGAVAVWVKN